MFPNQTCNVNALTGLHIKTVIPSVVMVPWQLISVSIPEFSLLQNNGESFPLTSRTQEGLAVHLASSFLFHSLAMEGFGALKLFIAT